jgi:hypothetical protein
VMLKRLEIKEPSYLMYKPKPVTIPTIKMEIDNMIKHKDKIIAKVGKETYDRLLKKLKEGK